MKITDNGLLVWAAVLAFASGIMALAALPD
jgi:hypothetical protein